MSGIIKKTRSELEILLEKNTYGIGLTPKEKLRAYKLIMNPVYSEVDCWVCKTSSSGEVEKAIYDTGLCQDHALYALITRK